MPALVKSKEGSSGIREEEGIRFIPFASKNDKYFSRISADVIYFMRKFLFISLLTGINDMQLTILPFTMLSL